MSKQVSWAEVDFDGLCLSLSLDVIFSCFIIHFSLRCIASPSPSIPSPFNHVPSHSQGSCPQLPPHPPTSALKSSKKHPNTKHPSRLLRKSCSQRKSWKELDTRSTRRSGVSKKTNCLSSFEKKRKWIGFKSPRKYLKEIRKCAIAATEDSRTAPKYNGLRRMMRSYCA